VESSARTWWVPEDFLAKLKQRIDPERLADYGLNDIRQAYYGPYLGLKLDDGSRTPQFLPYKAGFASHILFLGRSGYGKTSIMRALAEGLYDYFYLNGKKALIIVVEAKYDKPKVQKLKAFREYIIENFGYDYLMQTYPKIEEYLQEYYKKRPLLGKIGDFAFGWPNVEAMMTKADSTHNLFQRHRLGPMIYPSTRIVFRPTRDLDLIEKDNGMNVQVVEGKLSYERLEVKDLIKFAYVNTQTNYMRLLDIYWDQKRIRDPDRFLREVIRNEYPPRPGEKVEDILKNSRDRTIANLRTLMTKLKSDRLFTKDPKEEFVKKLTPDRINVIDFSANSHLRDEEEAVIFHNLVNYVVEEFPLKRDIPVFIIVDEVQNIAKHRLGLAAINKIYREGRSLEVSLISGTQYLSGLSKDLVRGATHIGVVGRLASEKDAELLEEILDERFDNGRKPRSLQELFRIRKARRGKGKFSIDCEYTFSIEYRVPKTL
jgi:DNA helicase HerA-like ATPase